MLAVFLYFLDVRRANCETTNNLYEIEKNSNHSLFHSQTFNNVTNLRNESQGVEEEEEEELKQKIGTQTDDLRNQDPRPNRQGSESLEERSFNVDFNQNRRISPYMNFYVPVTELSSIQKSYNTDINSLHLNPVVSFKLI